MDKELLTELVIKEATKLRKAATPQEISRLIFEDLSPISRGNCIYGMATGDCYSERAGYLILECCEKVFVKDSSSGMDKVQLNGPPTPELMVNRDFKHFSPIEIFILSGNNRTNGNNEMLIDYLKGEIDNLEFAKF